jgi:hypothetical protein
MEYPAAGGSASLRLDVGRPDHFAPFLCLLNDGPVQFGRRARKHRGTQVSDPRRDPGIDEPRIDLPGACSWELPADFIEVW